MIIVLYSHGTHDNAGILLFTLHEITTKEFGHDVHEILNKTQKGISSN